MTRTELLKREKFLEEQIKKSADMYEYLEAQENLTEDEKLLIDVMDRIYKDAIQELKKVVVELNEKS
jgi:hypothetical protein